MQSHSCYPRILVAEYNENSFSYTPSTGTCFSSPASEALPTPLLEIEDDNHPRDVYVMGEENPISSRHSSNSQSYTSLEYQKKLSTLDLVHFDNYSATQRNESEHADGKSRDILLSTTAHSPSKFTHTFNAYQYSKGFPPHHELNASFVEAYELGDELGSGGFGFVMTAHSREQGNEVAVKFIIKDRVPDHCWMYDDVMGHLPTEILLLSYLDHPNIVKCLDVFEDDVYFYLVQELHGTPWSKYQNSEGSPYINSPLPVLSPSASELSIDDLTLATPPLASFSPAGNLKPKQRLSLPKGGGRPGCSRRPSHDLFECIEQSQNKRIPEDTAKHIFSQVVDAVAYLDAHGVTHRDIKDENITIDKDFTVKLIDFGSAVIFDPDQPRPFHQAFFGTTAYAASEILLKKSYQTAPAEVWTLGVLLSYLLTGSSPFPTENDAKLGRIVLSYPEGREVVPSDDSVHLMEMCLHPDPSERITVDQMRNHPWLQQNF